MSISDPTCPRGRTGSLRRVVVYACALVALSCSEADVTPPVGEPEILTIPVVVHVIHAGEPIGSGHNLSDERIQGQIRTLNQDFRRRPGTPGHNAHPDGGDARIEFVLARLDPDGNATTGIVRVDTTGTANPTPPGSLFDHFAWYGYWDPERYVNVWTIPLPEETVDVVLGMATGPETDLPGSDLLLPGEPHQAEGILVNSWHFGSSSLASPHALGRTLTHEMGHYLGLLHLWGNGECATNDYCDDTPAVDGPVTGDCVGVPPIGCGGVPVMVENYMTYSSDACMNVFTQDQIARMRHVLQHSARRKSLPTSLALATP